jgi:peptidoglycan-associated lipoprotein
MRSLIVLVAGVALGASGCTHLVHEEDYEPFDPTPLETRMSTIESDVAAVRNDLNALRQSMADLERRMGAHVEDDDMHGAMRVALPVHFDFDAAEIRDVDRPILDAFAAGIRNSYPDAVVTVEGFTDRAGSPAHNMRLSQSRADNVANYLIETGGLNSDHVRTQAFGMTMARQVNPDAQGPGQSGIENRRVTFVVDYSGSTN